MVALAQKVGSLDSSHDEVRELLSSRFRVVAGGEDFLNRQRFHAATASFLPIRR